MTTAPVFVASTQALAGSRVVLDGAEGHHAAAVRRVRVGESIDVVDGFGTRVRGKVAAVSHQTVEVDVVERTHEAAAEPRVVVIQALAKGDRGERAVEAMSEVGVDVIVPWSASRSVVEWHGERGVRAVERWRSVAREAAKQARRARFPVVGEVARTPDVAAAIRDSALGVVLHEAGARSLVSYDLPSTGDIVLIVGPEGGLAPDELIAFEAAGAVVATLGPTVLRTSTAGVVAAALVLGRTQWVV